MAAFPKNDGSQTCKSARNRRCFPFLWNSRYRTSFCSKYTIKNLGGALVDATLMLQYNLNTGDSIKLGKLTLPITGVLKSIPGSTAVSTSVAPTVIIPFRFIARNRIITIRKQK